MQLAPCSLFAPSVRLHNHFSAVLEAKRMLPSSEVARLHAMRQKSLLCRQSSETWEAVGALARHVVLKAPDKADYRAVATEAAVTLMSQLPTINQHQFVLFAARLARTPKVAPAYLHAQRSPSCMLVLPASTSTPHWSMHAWHMIYSIAETVTHRVSASS